MKYRLFIRNPESIISSDKLSIEDVEKQAKKGFLMNLSYKMIPTAPNTVKISKWDCSVNLDDHYIMIRSKSWYIDFHLKNNFFFGFLTIKRMIRKMTITPESQIYQIFLEIGQMIYILS